jgi:multidrug efflux pump subunit AcrA (membrane-fusion protein)
MTSRSRLVAVSVAIAVAAGGTWFVTHRRAPAPVVNVESVPVVRTALVRRLQVTGTVSNPSQVSLSFPAGGKLTSVKVSPGDRVKAGQQLATIETEQLDAAARSARSALSAAEARAAQVRAGRTPAQAALDDVTLRQADQALTDARSNATATLGRAAEADRLARQALVTAQAKQSAAAADKSAADRELAARAGGAPEELDAARSRVQSTEAALRESTDGLSQAQVSARASADAVAQAQQEARTSVNSAASGLDQARAQHRVAALPPQRDQIAEADSATAAARQIVQEAERNLGAAVLVAPVDGTVVTLNGKVGDTLPAGGGSGEKNPTGFAVLDTTGAMEVRGSVPEADSTKVAVGQEAVVRFDALDGATVTAKVVAIDPSASNSGGVVTFGVRFQLTEATPPQLRPGMSAAVEVVLEQRPDALAVPAAALVAGDDGVAVKVRTAGGSQLRPVSTGMRADGLVEVIRGLGEGDTVEVRLDSGSGDVPGTDAPALSEGGGVDALFGP